ncbi:MAG: type II toxin-antitoxin system prevent-host-death family antitoxin [Acidimicrobiia bacterium]|nr:type II toxin-antitoxin system prevent-host-death family antitoxin [Acidimicrobiia bacterium]
MSEIAVRDLRNDTAGVLRRVEAGEDVVITVRGKPVAALVGIQEPRRRWLRRDDLVERLRGNQADPDLRRDLRELAGETTDDLDPIR